MTQANMQYSQGTGSQQLTSAGATNVGQTAITGMNNYRSGVAGQEAAAQQGGQAAVSAQNQAYGTQTSGDNTAIGQQTNYAIGKPSLGDTLGGTLGNVIQGIFAEGGVATEPTIAKLGERGPEAVVPLSSLAQYKSQRYRKAA
jgi:hypothetical protein